jgi:hypothetical protein
LRRLGDRRRRVATPMRERGGALRAIGEEEGAVLEEMIG